MADGRHFTDYRPNCHLNNNLRTNNDLKNTFEFRRFLQGRGEDLMKLNQSTAYEQNGCGDCKEPYHDNTMLAEQTRLYCDKNGCKAVVVNPDGLGQGRCYGPTKGHVREHQPSNCCGNANSVFSYFGEKNANHQHSRVAIPSGGNALNAANNNNANNNANNNTNNNANNNANKVNRVNAVNNNRNNNANANANAINVVNNNNAVAAALNF
jgi:hypothetical protein